jgi:hypothetical protein
LEEERVKSAFEIAMERISALPELTQEEIAIQKEKQFGPIGDAVASRFLRGLIIDDELPVELEKYRADPFQLQIVRRALITRLCRTLELEQDPMDAGKGMNGLCRIAPEKVSIIGEAGRDYHRIIGEYEQEKRKRSEAIEKSALRNCGISGTAVRCNPDENEYWREELRKIGAEYAPRLERLKSMLLGQLLETS